MQAMKQQGCIEVAHHMRTWDVSWAPNNEYRFVSCGDDGKLKFWDTRLARQAHDKHTDMHFVDLLPA